MSISNSHDCAQTAHEYRYRPRCKLAEFREEYEGVKAPASLFAAACHLPSCPTCQKLRNYRAAKSAEERLRFWEVPEQHFFTLHLGELRADGLPQQIADVRQRVWDWIDQCDKRPDVMGIIVAIETSTCRASRGGSGIEVHIHIQVHAPKRFLDRILKERVFQGKGFFPYKVAQREGSLFSRLFVSGDHSRRSLFYMTKGLINESKHNWSPASKRRLKQALNRVPELIGNRRTASFVRGAGIVNGRHERWPRYAMIKIFDACVENPDLSVDEAIRRLSKDYTSVRKHSYLWRYSVYSTMLEEHRRAKQAEDSKAYKKPLVSERTEPVEGVNVRIDGADRMNFDATPSQLLEVT